MHKQNAYNLQQGDLNYLCTHQYDLMFIGPCIVIYFYSKLFVHASIRAAHRNIFL